MERERGRRDFCPTEHLALEAIAAFVDGELRLTPFLRAAQHLDECPSCHAEVVAQQQARAALRHSGPIRMPAELLGQLRQIPTGEIPIAHPPLGPKPPQHTADDALGGLGALLRRLLG